MTTNGTDLDLRAIAEKIARERFNAVIGVHRYSVPPVWDKMADSFRADCIGYVEAGLRAQAPTPVAGPELSDSEVAGMIRDRYGLSRSALTDDTILRNRGFQEVALVKDAFARGRASAQTPSLLEAKREGWDAARDWHYKREKGEYGMTAWNAARDECFPLPAPAGITLSDGSVVRHDPLSKNEGFHWARRFNGTDYWHHHWFACLNHTHTGLDLDALKAYAAAQEKAR